MMALASLSILSFPISSALRIDFGKTFGAYPAGAARCPHGLTATSQPKSPSPVLGEARHCGWIGVFARLFAKKNTPYTLRSDQSVVTDCPNGKCRTRRKG